MGTFFETQCSNVIIGLHTVVMLKPSNGFSPYSPRGFATDCFHYRPTTDHWTVSTAHKIQRLQKGNLPVAFSAVYFMCTESAVTILSRPARFAIIALCSYRQHWVKRASFGHFLIAFLLSRYLKYI